MAHERPNQSESFASGDAMLDRVCRATGLEAFKFKPLKSTKAIRLLKFVSTTSLKCELVEVSLEEAPDYVALSYAWGDENDLTLMIVNNSLIKVQKNLYDALRARGLYCMTNGWYLWADAICINQADHNEKSEQVRMMKRIYDKATAVTAWLGTTDDESELAIDTLVSWQRMLQNREETAGLSLVHQIFALSHSDSLFDDLPEPDSSRFWIGLENLSQKPWWRRMWILQEATGPANTHFLLGSRRFEWTHVVIAMRVAGQLSNFRGRRPPEVFIAGHMFDLLIMHLSRKKGMRFLDSLQEGRRCACKDDSDRVYAVMDMACDIDSGDIIPDYNRKVEDLYFDVVKLMMRKSPEGHRLDFLGHVVRSASNINRIKANDDNLPSWLPDWRSQVNWTVLPKYLQNKGGKYSKVYNASADSKPEAIIEGKVFKITGHVVDSITSVLPLLEGLPMDNLKTIQDWSISNADSPYITGGTRNDAMLHTITADVDGTSRDTFSRGYAIDWSLIECDPSSLQELQLYSRDRMRGQLQNIFYSRRLCETRIGYIGLAPPAAEVGYQICCFYGGQALYVLRDRGSGYYEFIGECYVHGLMDGRAMEQCHEKLTFRII